MIKSLHINSNYKMLAVIKTGGKQYLVKEGDHIKIEKVIPAKGTAISFSEVMLLSDEKGEKVELGNPFIKGKTVHGKILEQARHKKVIILKQKPKKRYKIKRGHKQPYTLVAIDKI